MGEPFVDIDCERPSRYGQNHVSAESPHPIFHSFLRTTSWHTESKALKKSERINRVMWPRSMFSLICSVTVSRADRVCQV